MRAFYLSLIAASCLPLQATTKYHAPSKEKVFDLTGIPLEVDRIEALSTQLTLLARRGHENSPKQARINSGLLYLALQLNPDNLAARQLNKRYLKNKSGGYFNEKNAQSSINQLITTARALAGNTDNKDAQQLGKLLNDLVSGLTNQDSHEDALGHRWQKIIPDLASYTVKVKPVTPIEPFNPLDEVIIPAPDKHDKIDNSPPRKKKIGAINFPEGKLKFHHDNPSIYVPSFKNKKDLKLPTIEKIKLKISEDSENKHKLHFSTYGANQHNQGSRTLENTINQVLRKNFGKVSGYQIRFTNAPYQHERDYHLLTAPLSVALASSLVDHKLAANTLIYARASSNNVYSVPELWRHLDHLYASEKSYRVLTTKDSEAIFTQLLVRKNPSFFFQHEILMVDKLGNALNAAVNADPNLQKASAIFKEIKQVEDIKVFEKLKTRKQLIVKLKNVINLYPNHLSAKALLQYYSGKSPSQYSSVHTFERLNYILNQYHWLRYKTINNEDPDSFEKIATLVSDELEAHKKYFHPTYRNTFKKMMEDTDDIQTIAKSLRNGSGLRRRTAEKLLDKLKGNIKEHEAKLKEIAQINGTNK